MLQYSDNEIVEAIRQGGMEMERAMRFLYLDSPCREQVLKFVFSRNGVREDAEDIFQDGIRSLIQSIRADKYRGSGSLQGYLFGMCKNLWFKRFQKITRDQQYQNENVQSDFDQKSPETVLMGKEQEERITQLLGAIGTACKKVLELWQLSYSMKEIAEEMGYKTDGVARKKKRLCMKKLLDLLDQNPELKSFLKQPK